MSFPNNKMQKSFSIVDDEGVASASMINDDEEDLSINEDSEKSISLNLEKSPEKRSPENAPAIAPLARYGTKIPSPGPSGRQTVIKSRSSMKEKLQQLSSESDQEESDADDKEKGKILGEYDHTLYEDLAVDEETKEMFQFIIKYIPQTLNLDYKFKPFVPEYLPAVGDIDAFLKVIPPELTLNGDKFNPDQLQLGLTVLDEPRANQSDPALLHLQLRAAMVNPNNNNRNSNVVVKTVENVEKNAKVIDKWIKDITDLHKSKSSPIVRYSQPMPDLDDLMQEWPGEMEVYLKLNGFPMADDETALSDYVQEVCRIFQIPVGKNKIQSIHLLFCLYAAIKSTQLYQTSTVASNEKSYKDFGKLSAEEPDQLVLD